MTHEELLIEHERLNGYIKRVMITNNPIELMGMYELADNTLRMIYKERMKGFETKLEKEGVT